MTKFAEKDIFVEKTPESTYRRALLCSWANSGALKKIDQRRGKMAIAKPGQPSQTKWKVLAKNAGGRTSCACISLPWGARSSAIGFMVPARPICWRRNSACMRGR